MRRLILSVLVLLAGNLALLGVLRGREYSTVHLAHDPDGRILNAAPGSDLVARSGAVTLDYAASREGEPAPAASGAGTLADVRAAILRVREEFAVGDDYHATNWDLEHAVRAAREDGRRFMCDSYARAVVSYCLRQGLAARVVLLDGHITSEVFLSDPGTWVFADALYDFIATTPEGTPLPVLEASRRLRSGRPVVWTRVAGTKDDDDELDARNLYNLEGMLRRGRIRILDGPLGFGRLTRVERVADFLRGRTRMVEHAPPGLTASDRDERAVRGSLLAWNLTWPLIAGGLAARRPRPRREGIEAAR